MSLVGRQIGRYRILEQLGSGGMSVVYKGLDTALEREVAVKVLHPHLAGKEESRKRLAREAKAVAKLRHPNILEVFDFSTLEAPDAYIVTELIRGQTLRAYAETQRFDPPELAAMVVHEVAAALAHAHEAGVIHRDLKPDNVMVRDDGVLKLMDFGIAKIVDRDERMTMTGALVGSPAHMAPEIIEGEEAGPEADVFSLGTLLYLLATERLPFTAPNTTATLKRILDGGYDDPRTHCPALSDELAEIIARCLARDPMARYADGAKLRDALGEYLARFGLTRVDEELAAFFADPPGHRARLKTRLVESLLAQAQAFRGQRRPAKALGCLNQVLALAPEHAGARVMLEQIQLAKRREQRRKRLLRLGGELGAIAGLIALAVFAWRALPDAPLDSHLPRAQGEAGAQADTAAANPPPSAAATTKPEAAAVPSPQTPQAPPKAQQVVQAVQKVEAPAPPKPKLVPVTFRVRPFGYVQVDGEPRTAEALQQHVLNLAVGKHLVRVGCDLGCVETTKEIEVRPGRNVQSLAVRLEPAQLSFDYVPEDALVRIGDEVRTAKESRERPFRIESPDGPRKLQHQVSYEISKPGYATVRDTVWLPAGKANTLSGKLAAQ